MKKTNNFCFFHLESVKLSLLICYEYTSVRGRTACRSLTAYKAKSGAEPRTLLYSLNTVSFHVSASGLFAVLLPEMPVQRRNTLFNVISQIFNLLVKGVSGRFIDLRIQLPYVIIRPSDCVAHLGSTDLSGILVYGFNPSLGIFLFPQQD